MCRVKDSREDIEMVGFQVLTLLQGQGWQLWSPQGLEARNTQSLMVLEALSHLL